MKKVQDCYTENYITGKFLKIKINLRDIPCLWIRKQYF